MIKRPFGTLEEVSKATGFPETTLREWIKKGKIKATKPGRLILVYWDSVNDYIKKSEVEAS